MGLFSSDNTRNLKKLNKIAVKVEALEDKYASLTDEELRAQTDVLRERLKNGETTDDILPDAFAVCREASSRVLNMKHFHAQILGGIVLHQGRIAQMNTGEGKTLVATLPAYLNALTGKPVYVVTVNEYLAKTQAEWMSKLYNFLGLSVGVSLSNVSPEAKRLAYSCDITYVTNNELGFDYLRDNMVIDIKQRVLRELSYGIVDEVDSILIDESRTPLIISGRGMKSSDDYERADRFAKSLNENDYIINEEHKTIVLSDSGVEKAERFYNMENIGDVENMETNHYINNALKANYIMKLDSNYMVQDEEVIIVDEFTGRAMAGRRYSDGLHQAIEAKEGVKIREENKTIATITFQNLFRLFSKLSGMTGTAKTEETEFNKIYSLDVVVIPTNLPMIRKDYPDVIYKTNKAKVNAIVEEIVRVHETGQPILVGTTTIEKSEEISNALKLRKIKHHVLNAKSLQLEGELVAQAGRLGTVTVSTNMAGRGTDILLGGNPDFLAIKKLRDEGYDDNTINLARSYNQNKTDNVKVVEEKYNKYYKEFKEITDKEKEQVKALGGLYVLGTERHESRRIDNQLRGRAGRQGDPGVSVFYISLEDDLARRFGGETMRNMANRFKIADDVPFQLKILSKMIENAQKKIEIQNFAIRRELIQYDDVLNLQRKVIYEQRNQVLDGLDMRPQIVDFFRKTTDAIVYGYLDENKPYFEWDLDDINVELENGLLPKGTSLIDEKFVEDLDVDEVADKVYEYVMGLYNEKIAIADECNIDFSIVERLILLRVVDTLWIDHIDNMTLLRSDVSLRGYAQQSPVAVYKRDGMRMFDNMIEKIWHDVSCALLNVNIERAPQKPQPVAQPVFIQKTIVHDEPTIGRNDPCPCGSGKKYKNCCGNK